MSRPFIAYKTAEPQTLDAILVWHRGIVEALVAHQVSIRQSSAGASRFAGMTEGEVDAHYDANRRELDRLTVLNLVASAEGTLKVDYFRRVANKLKDPLSVAYRRWHTTLSAKERLRPDFDDAGILAVLKTTGLVDNHIIGQYRECLRVRHWLGHGRYWSKPVEVDRLDPEQVYDRADALLRALPI